MNRKGDRRLLYDEKFTAWRFLFFFTAKQIKMRGKIALAEFIVPEATVVEPGEKIDIKVDTNTHV